MLCARLRFMMINGAFNYDWVLGRAPGLDLSCLRSAYIGALGHGSAAMTTHIRQYGRKPSNPFKVFLSPARSLSRRTHQW
jgi:hypothetical protein